MHNYEVIKEEKSKSELSTSGIVNRINNSTNVIVERTHLHTQAFIRQMQACEIGRTPVREEGIRNLHSQIAAALERGTRVRACSGAATVCEERRRAERRRGRWRVLAIERGARVTVVRQRSPARRWLAESPPERRRTTGCVKRPLIREDLKVIQYQSQEADNTFITSDGTSPYVIRVLRHTDLPAGDPIHR